MACKRNIFFQHKIWFNLKACLINKNNQRQINKIFKLITEIQIIIEQSTHEKLYIANSSVLLKMIEKSHMNELLDDDLN